MRKAILIACLLAAAIALSGCVNPLNPCNINTPELCNKSCVLDEDCSFNCGAGCINRNENFDFGGVTIFCQMPPGGCKCVEGQCEFVAVECAGEGEEFSDIVDCCHGLVKAVNTCEKCREEGEALAFDGIPCCEDLVAVEGFCRRPGSELPCAEESESIPVIAQPPECCAGLTLIPPKEANIVGITGYCTAKCGNGTCDEIESSYNCQADCAQI